MAAPSIYGITPFDAMHEYTVTFTHDQRSYGNKVSIWNANTLELVYERSVDYGNMAGSLIHIIPAGSLVNGVRYLIEVSTKLKNGDWQTSSGINFYCFKQPTLNFINIREDHMVFKESFEANVSYNSEDGEPLQSFNFLLYDYNKQLIYSSPTLYTVNAIMYTYTGLETGVVYYLRCRGNTMHNMTVDSGYVMIETEYSRQPYYSLFYAENDNRNGYVKYHTNMKVIVDAFGGEFEYDNGWINLKKDELNYNENFVINGDFSLLVKGRDMFRNTNHILTLSSYDPKTNPNGGIVYLSSYIYSDGGYAHNGASVPYLRFRLTATVRGGDATIGLGSHPGESWQSAERHGGTDKRAPISANLKPTPLDYVIYSDPLVFSPQDEITIFIMRMEDIYTIEVAVNDTINIDTLYANEAFGDA